MYASSPFIYGYQLRLIIGSLEVDLSRKIDDDDDDLHMPLVHRAIHRLRDFFFVGKQPSLEVVVEIDSDSHYQCEMKDMYPWYDEWSHPDPLTQFIISSISYHLYHHCRHIRGIQQVYPSAARSIKGMIDKTNVPSSSSSALILIVMSMSMLMLR